MKKLCLFTIIVLGLLGCQDDKSSFDASITNEAFSFRPIPGGAVMHYQLPQNGDIFSIRVRYTNAIGLDAVKDGSYACDSLVIDGFTEARHGERAYVTLLNNKNEESVPVEVSFDTEDSATITFFEKAKVTPHWNGFQLIYDGPEISTGSAHVFYLGTNPMTQKPDTVWMKTFQIAPGVDTLLFNIQQERDFNTVIIRTADYKGFRVKQQVWEDVEALKMEVLEPSKFEFNVPEAIAFEHPEWKLGKEYLFDGDRNGVKTLTTGPYDFYAFMVGPQAWGKEFLIDLKDSYDVAALRIYAPINQGKNWPSPYDRDAPRELAGMFYGNIEDKLPSHVNVYATNDPDGEWVKITDFYQGAFLEETSTINRWTFRNFSVSDVITGPEEIERADPIYIHMEVPYGQKYRYLKMVVEKTFARYSTNTYDWNPSHNIFMQELEIYVKKQ